ncbi:MAG TPA: ArsA-related P-loop ATPase [Thermodesulfobacteriota bacterium]|nr:ArsA-related P-loop ATPase [Thermodesulfobacteriota bacterium]
MDIDDLLRKKLIVVTGKGGVGKTAVSLALSYLNSGRGRSPLYVTLKEVKRGSFFFGCESGIDGKERPLDGGVNAVYIDPTAALTEYIRENFVRLYPVYATILKSKTLQTFFEAAPGLKELITIGKVWHLGKRGGGRAKPYDQVIFDAPSTGHAIPVLDLPSKVLQMVRGGAFRSHIEWVEGFLKNPEETAVVVVSGPEEMVVGETLELIEAVRAIGISVLFTVVNKVYETPFTKDEEEALSRIVAPEIPPDARRVLGIAKEHMEMAKTSERYLTRLRGVLKDSVLAVPRIFKKDLVPVDLKYMASRIGSQLGGRV